MSSLAFFLNSNFWTLPVEVLGSGKKNIFLGNLNPAKLSLQNLSLGSFFEATEGLIYHEDNTDFGFIDIYIGFLGTDSSEVTGTGQLAILQFQAIAGGASTVAFTDYSEFVDHEDNDIAILGKGTCVVTVGN